MSVRVIFFRLFLFALLLFFAGLGQNCFQPRDANGNGGGYTGIKPDLAGIVGKTYVRRLKASSCTNWYSEINVVSTTSILYREDVCSMDPAIEIPPSSLNFRNFSSDFLILSGYKVFQYQMEGVTTPPPYTESFCIGGLPEHDPGMAYNIAIQQINDGTFIAKIFGGVLSSPGGGYVPVESYTEAVTSRTVTTDQIVYQTASFQITVDRRSSSDGTPKYDSQVEGNIYGTQNSASATCIIQNLE